MLDLYDRRIRPAPSQVPLEMIDASAMLWRLQLRGVDVGRSLAATWPSCWGPFVDHAYYAFNDAHAVMSFVGAQRMDLAQRAIAAMEQKCTGTDTNAMMTREVGLPLAQALVSFADRNYSDVVRRLLAIRTIASRFGGSNAQRDLIHLTLVGAALRVGSDPAGACIDRRADSVEAVEPVQLAADCASDGVGWRYGRCRPRHGKCGDASCKAQFMPQRTMALSG